MVLMKCHPGRVSNFGGKFPLLHPSEVNICVVMYQHTAV